MGEEVGVDGQHVVDATGHELALGLDAALSLDEYPTSSGTVDGVVGLLDEAGFERGQGGEENGMPASLMRIVDHSVSLKWLTL